MIEMDDRVAPVATLPEVATSDGNQEWLKSAANWSFATIATTFYKLRIYWKRRVEIAGDGGNRGNRSQAPHQRRENQFIVE